MDDKTTGRRIRQMRDKKAWTQEHLAGAAGVSVRTVQRAEEGVMSAETLSAIAGALDTTVEDLTVVEAAYPHLVPILHYDDPASLDWLENVLGFATRMRYAGPNGKILHAELTYEDCMIMVGAPDPTAQWATPRQLEGVLTQSIYLRVSNVDAHHTRARDLGARILSEPEDGYGQRRYRLVDPEGHLWTIATLTE